MLKSWSLENFKPIVNSGNLKLAPVTILAGRNSSGKSSLLQSILMIAQTLGNQLPERALLPNERIVQLGTFDDILSEHSDLQTLSIGFELEMDGDEQNVPSKQSFEILFPSKQNYELFQLKVKSVKIFVKFTGGKSTMSNASTIEASNIMLDRALLEFECEFSPEVEGLEAEIDFRVFQEMKPKLSLIIQSITQAELNLFLQDVAPSYRNLIPNSGKQPYYLGDFITDDTDTQGQFLVALLHFLPTRLIRRSNLAKLREQQERLLENDINSLFEAPSPETLSSKYSNVFNSAIDIDTAISVASKRAVDDFCMKYAIPDSFSGRSLRELVRWFQSLHVDMGMKNVISPELRRIVTQDLMQNQLKAVFENYQSAAGLESVNNSSVDVLDQAMEYITRFFTSQIRYLGPLRSDPGTIQNSLSPTSELDNIGPKGEYSAAVYDYHQNTSIEWFNPRSKQVERGILQEALDVWAHYLGVAHQIRTDAAGGIGVTWKVVIKKGQKSRTLPAVGVGLSQVLPILVMGLLSPRHTLLIIEQPELHLHAKVQALLGDFFMGLAQCNKQCLIETHSENLVSQLRYHIVQSGGQEESGCAIYFVDQDEQGTAIFEAVEISAKGNILNWPDGFFDETMHQEDRINTASIRRRAKLTKNG